MTELHPITPPPELVQQWLANYFGCVANGLSDSEKYLAIQAARWGYEQRGAVNEAELQKARDEELEACCEWLINEGHECEHVALREGRRPKPPSLKEQALIELNLTADPEGAELSRTQVELIRRALESLPF